MTTYFTICSNNYLAQATVLGLSVKRHIPASTFIILLADLKSSAVDYAKIPFEVLPAGDIEPRAEELARKYNIIEFNTCVKPRVIEYLFTERNAERVTYLDPDTKVFSPFTAVEELLDSNNVVLTPHIYTPIPLDGKDPTDNLFLRYGIYNLGFVATKRSDETFRFIRWWKERTYALGYARPELGQFVDQLYINFAPISFEGVTVLRHYGYNVAPWNIHERTLSVEGGNYRVNGSFPLALFHFSKFKLDAGELPVEYTRFLMKDRPDLVDLYSTYNQELTDAGFANLSRVKWAYSPPPEKRPALRELKRQTTRVLRGGIRWGVSQLPPKVRDRLKRT
jgi:hypothetical protein